MKLNRILITGGAGFIGSNLALTLVKKGYQVRVLDNLSSQVHGKNPEETSPLYQSILNKVDFIEGTVTSNKDWIRAIEGQDAVIHLAAETGTGQSMYEIKKYSDINIGGTALMLDILSNQAHTIKKIIVASSRAIYGEGKYNCPNDGIVYPESRSNDALLMGDFNCKCPICNSEVQLLATSEDSRIHPTSIYGITKHGQEQMALTVGKTIGVPTIVFRYQNVYGPGQSLSNPYTGIFSIFSTQIRNGNSIDIYEDGKESRDFVFISDVVKATILGLEDHSIMNAVFNVGSGSSIDVLSVANKLKSIYQVNVDINISGNYRIGDIRHNYADLTRIVNDLSYEPEVSFDQGIILFTDWVIKQRKFEDNYLKSINELRSRGLFK